MGGEKRENYERAMSCCGRENMIHVDESGMGKCFHRRRVQSFIGRKMFGFVPGKKFRRTNAVTGYADGKTMAECVCGGPIFWCLGGF
jgi:hypothetical protein